MISIATLAAIKAVALSYWQQHVIHSTDFQRMLINKESGHSMADYVDAKTVEEVRRAFPLFSIKFEDNKRSMGDFWLSEIGTNYDPINIKAGTTVNGSPNMVSMNKLIEMLAESKIDSYYLLFIKFSFTNNKWTVMCHCVNILNYLDCLCYDSGPGQIMIKESMLYPELEKPVRADCNIKNVLDTLIKMQDDKLSILIKNRTEDIQNHKKIINSYDSSKAIDQTKIKLI